MTARLAVILLVGGLLTYLTRLSFILVFERWRPPELLQRALRFVPPAVLAAIIFPEMLLHSGSLDLSLSNPRLLAGIAAGLVAWKTRNVVATIASGMAVLLLLMWLL